MRARRLTTTAIALVLATAGLPTLFAAPAAAAPAPGISDFNGDGYNDLVISAANGTVNGKKHAGYAAVVYGSSKGADPARRQVISQDTPGVPGAAETGDTFGSTPLTGDLNGDGYADLVLSAFSEDLAGLRDAGAAVILWGSPKGLQGGTWLQAEVLTEFGGYTVDAAGDFDGDGRLDLADAGSYLTQTEGRIYLGPFSPDYGARREARLDDGQVAYATSATTGDLDGDGRDDLIAVLDYDHEIDHAFWYRGTSSGLKPMGSISVGGSYPYIQGGFNATTGDFNGDGYDDYAQSLPLDIDDPSVTGGQLLVFPGGPAGPGSESYQISQENPGVSGGSEEGDDFGSHPAAGDVNGDGYDDVTVGVSGEDENSGRVVLLYGGPAGILGDRAQSVSQSTAGMPGVSEPYDDFGQAVSLTDTNGDGRADLAVGAPGEDLSKGSVWVLPASGGRFDTARARAFGSPAVGVPVASSTMFGSQLSQ